MPRKRQGQSRSSTHLTRRNCPTIAIAHTACPECQTACMDTAPRPSHELRTAGLSAFAGLLAPLVFVLLIALRKIRRRANFHFKFWNQRVKRELARWS